MRVNGAHRDSGQGSCCAISIGCTISICNMMHPHSTPTHSSRSLRDGTRSFPSGSSTSTNHESPVTNRSASAGTGYVELPYTLPQDSTLFLLLRERSIDLWKTKVDWIAAHGGMILLDTHPDYMTMRGAGLGGTNIQPNSTINSWNTFVPIIRVNIGMCFPSRWRVGSACKNVKSRRNVPMGRPLLGLR